MYVRLNEKGVSRVLSGMVGMVFKVKHFTTVLSGDIAHVYDFRFVDQHGPAVWSINADGYDKLIDAETLTYETVQRLRDELRFEKGFLREANERKQRIYDSLKSEIAHRNKLETKVGELERALKSCAEGREAVATWGAKAQNEVLRLSALLDERRMELAKLQDADATVEYVVGFYEMRNKGHEDTKQYVADKGTLPQYTLDRSQARLVSFEDARRYVIRAPKRRFMERA